MITNLHESILTTRMSLRQAWATLVENTTRQDLLLEMRRWGIDVYEAVETMKEQALEDPDIDWEDVESLVWLRHACGDLLCTIDDIFDGILYD